MEIIREIIEMSLLLPVMVFIVEMILNRWWSSVYFRKGILLFNKSFRFHREPSPSIIDLNTHLTFEFRRVLFPNMAFYNISNSEIAFRASFVNLVFIYFYIMRGLIRIDKKNGRVTILGFLNWYVLCSLCIFALYIIIAPPTMARRIELFGLFLLVCVLLFLGILSKLRLYNKIYRYTKKEFQ